MFNLYVCLIVFDVVSKEPNKQNKKKQKTWLIMVNNAEQKFYKVDHDQPWLTMAYHGQPWSRQLLYHDI